LLCVFHVVPLPTIFTFSYVYEFLSSFFVCDDFSLPFFKIVSLWSLAFKCDYGILQHTFIHFKFNESPRCVDSYLLPMGWFQQLFLKYFSISDYRIHLWLHYMCFGLLECFQQIPEFWSLLEPFFLFKCLLTHCNTRAPGLYLQLH
jgi:ABC-type sugar transport system permease subunit